MIREICQSDNVHCISIQKISLYFVVKMQYFDMLEGNEIFQSFL